MIQEYDVATPVAPHAHYVGLSMVVAPFFTFAIVLTGSDVDFLGLAVNLRAG